MPVPITMPDLQSGSKPVRLSCWLIDVNDSVAKADRIVEVLTSGMTFDIESPVDGILIRADVVAEDEVQPGDVLGWIEPTAEG